MRIGPAHRAGPRLTNGVEHRQRNAGGASRARAMRIQELWNEGRTRVEQQINLRSSCSPLPSRDNLILRFGNPYGCNEPSNARE
jgi:hypothetical protein